ncbi:hypothetical protein T265_12741, partial [Opisthorchis viverrini]
MSHLNVTCFVGMKKDRSRDPVGDCELNSQVCAYYPNRLAISSSPEGVSDSAANAAATIAAAALVSRQQQQQQQQQQQYLSQHLLGPGPAIVSLAYASQELIVCESSLVKVWTAGTCFLRSTTATRVPHLSVDPWRVVDFLLSTRARVYGADNRRPMSHLNVTCFVGMKKDRSRDPVGDCELNSQ